MAEPQSVAIDVRLGEEDALPECTLLPVASGDGDADSDDVGEVEADGVRDAHALSVAKAVAELLIDGGGDTEAVLEADAVAPPLPDALTTPLLVALSDTVVAADMLGTGDDVTVFCSDQEAKAEAVGDKDVLKVLDTVAQEV